MNAHSRGRISEPIDSNTDASSSGGDPRVAVGLDEYLAELQAGRRPSREQFLNRHPDIADELDRGLDVLEFLHSAAGAGASRPSGPTDADALPPETTLGDYRLLREVGRGGMGVVYEALQISLGRRVAVKVLSGAGVLDPRRLQRFRIEAQAVAQLNHAHIVPIFGVGYDRGIHYYAMQYVEGCTLAEILENHPGRQRDRYESSTLDPGSHVSDSSSRESVAASNPEGPSSGPEGSSFRLTQLAAGASFTPIASRHAFRAIARLAVQAAEGLDHAHTLGILHRDIKPSNLLVDVRGNLWITDFGLARFQDDSGLTLTGDLLGTLRYMAPEMAMGSRMSFDPRSDIYALGATLYELLTLRPVFAGSDRRELLRQITQDEPVPPRRIDHAIPRDLETIVMKAMAKEPERRYPSARELADDLGRFLADQSIQARPPSPWDRVAKLARRHRAVVTWAASAALVALGIASVLIWQEQQRTARAKDDSGEILRLWTLADDLTIKGMGKFAMSAMSAQTPDEQARLRDFYRQAISFYDRLAKEPSTSPRVQALAFRRLGFTRMVSLRDMRAAEDYRRSIALYEGLLAAEPRDVELRDGLADVHYNLGMLLLNPVDKIGRSEPSFRKAIALLEERALESPMEPDLLEVAAGHHLEFAARLEEFGKKDDSVRERRAVLDFFERLTTAVLASGPAENHEAILGWAANSYGSLAKSMAEHKWPQEQEAALRRGLKFAPKRPDLLYDLAILLAFRSGADRDAVSEAVDLARQAAGAVPNKPEYWRVLALAHVHARDWQSAADAVDKSLKLQKEEVHASDRLLMAMVSWHQGRQDDAKGWYIRAVDLIANHPAADPDVPKYWPEVKKLLSPVLVAEHLEGSTDR